MCSCVSVSGNGRVARQQEFKRPPCGNQPHSPMQSLQFPVMNDLHVGTVPPRIPRGHFGRRWVHSVPIHSVCWSAVGSFAGYRKPTGYSFVPCLRVRRKKNNRIGTEAQIRGGMTRFLFVTHRRTCPNRYHLFHPHRSHNIRQHFNKHFQLKFPQNWDAETAGKTIFVKFLAPW